MNTQTNPPESPISKPNKSASDVDSSKSVGSPDEIRKARQEHLKLRYAAKLEEYKAVRAEVVAIVGFQSQMLNFALITTAALITASDRIVTNRLFWIFAVAPVIYYTILLTHLRYTLFVVGAGRYIATHLADGLETILAEIAKPTEEDEKNAKEEMFKWHLFAWEAGANQAGYAGKGETLLEYARYLILAVGAIVTMVVYLLYVISDHTYHRWSHTLYIALNVIMLDYAAYIGLNMRERIGKLANERDSQSNEVTVGALENTEPSSRETKTNISAGRKDQLILFAISFIIVCGIIAVILFRAANSHNIIAFWLAFVFTILAGMANVLILVVWRKQKVFFGYLTAASLVFTLLLSEAATAMPVEMYLSVPSSLPSPPPSLAAPKTPTHKVATKTHISTHPSKTLPVRSR